jgi:hypothetical protein
MIGTPPPPPAPTLDVDVDAELRRLQPGLVASAAALVVAGTGVLVLLMAVQVDAAFVFRGPYKALPFLPGAAGVASLPLALLIFRLRPGAAIAATALHGLLGVATAFWFYVLALNGVIALAGTFVPPLAMASAILSGLAIGRCVRARAARRRLAAAGIDVKR